MCSLGIVYDYFLQFWLSQKYVYIIVTTNLIAFILKINLEYDYVYEYTYIFTGCFVYLIHNWTVILATRLLSSVYVVTLAFYQSERSPWHSLAPNTTYKIKPAFLAVPKKLHLIDHFKVTSGYLGSSVSDWANEILPLNKTKLHSRYWKNKANTWL